MTSSSNRASTYVDFLIVQALLEDPFLHKKAQQAEDNEITPSAAGATVQNYVNNNIDHNDKVGSVINMLAPGVIWTTLGMMGFGKIGFFLGLADRVFHLDVASILRSIGEKLKEALSGGKQMTSDQVRSIVQGAVGEHNTPATQEEAQDAARQQAAQQTEPPAQANDGAFARDLRYAKLLSLAISEYAKEQRFNKKTAIRKNGDFFSWFGSQKKIKANLLGRVLSFLFLVFLASAGLMVLGDAINHFLGRPNAIDNPIRDGKPVGEGPASSSGLPAATQNKFLPNPSYQDIHHDTVNASWVENTPNNNESIGQMLINFAKEVYQGLDGKESDIQSSPRFQTLVDTIAWYNHMAINSPVVFIPRMFSTKKQLVDAFIDDVASKVS
jgi:hypothetical protein